MFHVKHNKVFMVYDCAIFYSIICELFLLYEKKPEKPLGLSGVMIFFITSKLVFREMSLSVFRINPNCCRTIIQ